MSELEDQIKVVAAVRQKAQSLIDEKKRLSDEFEAQHSEFFGEVSTAIAVVSGQEDKLRELTLQAYEADPSNKNPAPGVGIRVSEKLLYDGQVAFGWAKEHNLMLQLNVKAFETFAKEGNLDFVTVSQEASATIAQNLEI